MRKASCRARARLGLKQLETDWPEEQSYLFGLLTEQIDKHPSQGLLKMFINLI